MASIRQKPNGNWEARYYAGPKLRARTFGTKKEAARFAAHQRVAIDQGTWRDPKDSRIRFSEWVEIWEQSLGHIRDTTRASYEATVRNHLLPVFGQYRLSDIDPTAITNWVNDCRGKGMGAPTLAKANRLLAQIMNAAVRARRIPSSPMPDHSPREPETEMRFLNAEQVAELATEIGPHHAPLVFTAAYTGLRWGELAGLRTRNVDLLHSRLTVIEQLTEIKGPPRYVEPKTKASRRAVTLPAFLIPMLEPLLGRETDPVFRSTGGMLLRRHVFRQRAWVPATRACDIEGVRFHDLRHTAVALAISAGAHPKAIQQRMGHKSITLTLDRYGHLFPGTDDALATALDTLHHAAPNSRQRRASITVL